jgi:hypothetical protein
MQRVTECVRPVLPAASRLGGRGVCSHCLRAYPITVPEGMILATARGCRLREEVQGWTKTE